MNTNTSPASELARRRWNNRKHNKTCPVCLRIYAADSRQIYCSDKCSWAAAARRRATRRRGAQA